MNESIVNAGYFAVIRLLQISINFYKIKIIYDILGGITLSKFYYWQATISFISLLMAFGLPFGLTTYLAKRQFKLNSRSCILTSLVISQCNHKIIKFLILLLIATFFEYSILNSFNSLTILFIVICSIQERDKLIYEGFLRGISQIQILIRYVLVYLLLDFTLIITLNWIKSILLIHLSFIVPVVFSNYYLRKKTKIPFLGTRNSKGKIAKSIMPTSMTQYLSSIVNQGSSLVVLHLIEFFSGKNAMILFQTANRIYMSSCGFVAQAINSDFYPQIARISDNKTKLTEKLNYFTCVSVILAGTVIVIITLFFNKINLFLFDGRMYFGDNYIKYFSIGFLILYSKQLIDTIPALYGKLMHWFIINCISSINKILLILIFGITLHSSYNIAFLLQCIISSLVCFWYCNNRIGIKISKKALIPLTIQIILIAYA